jgi:hypothetical protein
MPSYGYGATDLPVKDLLIPGLMWKKKAASSAAKFDHLLRLPTAGH